MMEQQLKERLVGASVLVVVSVIFIPWVLDGPGRGSRTTQSIDLPPAESSASGDNSKTFRLSLTGDQSTRPDDQNNGEKVGADLQTAPQGTARTATGRQEAGSAESGASGWTVQAGSFSNRENARTLVRNLKAHGFEAYINQHDSGGTQHFRVRVGEFKTRDDADALAIRIRGETGEPARPVQFPD